MILPKEMGYEAKVNKNEFSVKTGNSKTSGNKDLIETDCLEETPNTSKAVAFYMELNENQK